MPECKNELIVEGPIDYEDLLEGGFTYIWRVVSCDVEESKCNLEYENRPIPTAGLSDTALRALPEGWAKAPEPRFFTLDLRKQRTVDDEVIAMLREDRGVTVTKIEKPGSAVCFGD